MGNDSLEERLRKASFIRHRRREIYINPDSRKIITLEAILDNSRDWLKGCMNDPPLADGWRLYPDLSDRVKRDILAEIDPNH